MLWKVQDTRLSQKGPVNVLVMIIGFLNGTDYGLSKNTLICTRFDT